MPYRMATPEEAANEAWEVHNKYWRRFHSDPGNGRGVAAMSPEEAQAVTSRADLVRYLADLAARVGDGRVAVENESAPEFIDAAGHWVQAMDGFFSNRGEGVPDTPSWSLVAMIFSAALVYE